jgi:hypothetical protein
MRIYATNVTVCVVNLKNEGDWGREGMGRCLVHRPSLFKAAKVATARRAQTDVQTRGAT